MPTAIGLRVHSGWAAVVTVAGTLTTPQVLDRRRIELADPRIRGSVQPYHMAKTLGLEKARAFLDRCAKASQAMAESALQDVMGRYAVAACGMLISSGRAGKTLESILASHAAIHSAEGDFFRDAISRAVSASLPCRKVREKELFEIAQAAFHTDARDSVDNLRKTLGSPWTQDEKFAAIAGWLALADDVTS